jgi:hypothetical protein
VLLDPRDDVAVTVGLLERHDPDSGLVVVHPTPAATGLASAAHDVLAALGRAVNRLAEESLAGERPAWRAVEAWLVADEVEHLVVLRAHRLTPAVWHRLTQVCHRSGVGLLLVAHVPAVPATLATVLAGTGCQTLTDPARAYRILTAGHRSPASIQTSPQTTHQANEAADVDQRAQDRNLQASAQAIGGMIHHGDPEFGRGRHQARQWLTARARDLPGRDVTLDVALDITEVQLLLGRLVQDSVDLDRTQARLAGARSAFADDGLDLQLPPLPAPCARALRGQLYGPGLPRPSDLLDHGAVARIRAGVAHPVLAAGIAAALLSELPTQTLHSLPWHALGAGETTLCLSQFAGRALLQPRPGMDPLKAQRTAVLPVPAPARALFRAARHFSRRGDALPERMFAATRFSSRFLEPAAANCGIRLPDQPDPHRSEFRSITTAWQVWITCTRTATRRYPLVPAALTKPRSRLRAVS